MKTITFRKKWVIAISKLPKKLRNDAVVAVYIFLSNGKNDHPETLIYNLLRIVERDVKKSDERRKKARLKRQQKKVHSIRSKVASNPVTADAMAKREYEEHPELYMFDGFMSYLISQGPDGPLPEVPDGMNAVTLLCYFRDWVIKNRKLGELTKLNSFCGLFRHALPDLIQKVAA